MYPKEGCDKLDFIGQRSGFPIVVGVSIAYKILGKCDKEVATIALRFDNM